MVQPTQHIPVLPAEALAWLNPQPGQTIIDGTFGGGGHTRLIAAQVGSNGRVVALDRDPTALQRGRQTELPPWVELHQADFRDLPQVMAQLQLPPVHGVLLDIGLSSDQLADAHRGFSYTTEGELDLRFDPEEGEPAWELLQRLSEQQLADLIYRYGEERLSRRIAKRIVEQRGGGKLRTAEALAELVRSCVPRSPNHRIDPATRTFQALRIAVNDELGALTEVLQGAPDCLAPGGRLVVISFHSLEDRLVKQAFRADARLSILTKKPIRPSESEIFGNPRSRSARLRAAERR